VSICCDEHQEQIDTPKKKFILSKIYVSHVVQMVYQMLKKADSIGIYPPDHIVYQNTEFLAYHRVISCWKNIGETPLSMMERVREQHAIPPEIKSCYTGRLDPMAQGISCILVGSQNVIKMMEYNRKSKSYCFNAILGVSTDSYDPLGKMDEVQLITQKQADDYASKLSKSAGKFYQEYPAKSGHMYKSKPLWKHAMNGTLPDKMPGMEREIYNIQVGKPVQITIGTYVKDCCNDIRDVNKCCGEVAFQGSTHIKTWRTLAVTRPDLKIWKITVTAYVSSGTFVRSIVVDTAKHFNIPAHAFRITRIYHE